MGWTTPPKPLMPPEDTTTYLTYLYSRPKYRIIKLSEYKYYIEIKTWYGWRKLKTPYSELRVFRRYLDAEDIVKVFQEQDIQKKQLKRNN